MTVKNQLPIQRKNMAHPVRFVVFGNDEPLLSVAVGKEGVIDTFLLTQIVGGDDSSPFGVHSLFCTRCG